MPHIGEQDAFVQALLGAATGSGSLMLNSRPSVDYLGVGGVVPDSDASGGIQFPASWLETTTNDNTLDDFERGSFTPVVEGATSAGVGTYTYQVGRYVKVGTIIAFSLAVRYTAHTGTGNTRISGLPFASTSVGNLIQFVTIGQSGGPAPGIDKLRLARIPNATNYISLHEFDQLMATFSTSNPMVATTSIFWVTGMYMGG